MFNRIRSRRLLPLAALALSTLLGGCYYGGYPGYGYYDGGGGGYYASGYYGAPYYSGATVAIGTGWGWRDHDRGWHGGGGWRGHDRGDHGGWRR
jgi:hypothetical protein